MRVLNSRPRWLAAVTGMATLVATSMSSPAVAATPDGDVGYVGNVSKTTSSLLTTDQALAQARKTGTKVEVTAATTATDLLTANPDGTLTMTRTAAPIRQRVGGQWKNLDATLTANPDGSLSPAVSTSPVVLSGGGTSPLAKLSGAGLGFDLSVPMTLPKPTVAGDTATYADVLPGVNLQATASVYGGFSEVFVVRDAAAAANPALKKLVLAAHPSGITLASDAANNVAGKDAAGRTVLSAPTPLMWDSTTTAATTTTQRSAVTPSTTSRNAGAARAASSPDGPGAAANVAPLPTTATSTGITLTPGSMLQDSTTHYPLYIDPDFQWTPASPTLSGWATVAKSHADSNYWKATPDRQGFLQVGYSGDTIVSRTLLNFALPSVLKGATINSAELNMSNNYSYSCDARPISLYAPTTKLTSGNAKWTYWDGVNLGAAVQTQSFAHGYDTSCKPITVGFDVTKTINADVNGSNPQTLQTFMLKAGDETDKWAWKNFLLSTVSMTVTYNHTPDVPTKLTSSPSTACNASPASAVGNGPLSLYAYVTDPDAAAGGSASLGAGFQLYKTQYASLFPSTGDGDSTKLVASTPMSSTASNKNNAVLNVPQDTLSKAADVDGASNKLITQFSWRVRVTDFPASPSDTSHYSKWSAPCTFRYDPTRTGAPTVVLDTTVTDPSVNTFPPVQGKNSRILITPNSNGTTPSGYLIQVNGGAPYKVTADATGAGSAQIKPTRFSNVVTVTSLSPGGNIGDTGSLPVTAYAATPAQPDDFNGDDIADLVTVGGTNNLPPGLWLAAGNNNGQVMPVAANIGVYGTGQATVQTPKSYTGTQVITGRFTGYGSQDVISYHTQKDPAVDPATGTGSILTGSGDGTPIQPSDSNQGTISGLQEISPDDFSSIQGTEPNQVATLNTVAADGTASPFASLLGTSKAADGTYHVNYFENVNGTFGNPVTLAGLLNPAGGTDWKDWTMAGTLTHDPTTGHDSADMFLWNRSTGALALWRNVQYDNGPKTLTATKYTLNTDVSKWATVPTSLQAADINRDGTPDLWALGTGATVTSYLVTGVTSTTGTTGAVANQTPQTLVTGNHAWLLNDQNSGNVDAATAKDIVGDLDASGATAGAAGATDGATWDTNDLFSPDVELNGPDAHTKTGYLTTKSMPVPTNASFTLSVWAKPTTGGTVLSQDGKNTAAYKLWADPSDKSWRFAMSQGDTTTATWDSATAGPASAPWNAWSQLTVTYDATTGLGILYVNSVYMASFTHTVKWTPADSNTTPMPMRIGAHRSGTGTATAGYFGGKVAFVQTWNRMWKYPVAGNHDFNGDGRNDVVTVGSDGKMWLYANRSTGTSTFAAPVSIGVGWSSYRWDISDWDLDGYADLLGYTTDGILWWYPNNHASGFRSRVQLGVGWNGFVHSTGNADANMHPDHFSIRTTTDPSGKDPIGTLYHYPNGCCRVVIGHGWSTYRMVPGDLNNDNRDDLVAVDSSGNLFIYPNTGNPGDQMFTAGRTQIGTGWGSFRYAVIDINVDGKPDIIGVDANGNAYLFPGTGAGTLGTKTQIGSGWTTTVATTIG
ncbi:hypothetical protein ACWT_6809 [Actinoplanes sp. SE50]|nr:hypothetical protein ACPL_6940 [Actinoplanes sp. SE50/110]ATO86224.1 hypothetical protein ACWT_6809 [Actinoplanes sp. SE50]SLM03639.1 hypothetical protein ACSP50_6932 [Actinoplanes sp. SE50/110]